VDPYQVNNMDYPCLSFAAAMRSRTPINERGSCAWEKFADINRATPRRTGVESISTSGVPRNCDQGRAFFLTPTLLELGVLGYLTWLGVFGLLGLGFLSFLPWSGVLGLLELGILGYLTWLGSFDLLSASVEFASVSSYVIRGNYSGRACTANLRPCNR